MQSEHTQLRIRTYTDSDRDEIIRLVLHCQNDGTRPPVTVSDQPELLHINEKYMESGGCFWVAMDGGRLHWADPPRRKRHFKKVFRLRAIPLGAPPPGAAALRNAAGLCPGKRGKNAVPGHAEKHAPRTPLLRKGRVSENRPERAAVSLRLSV